MSTAGGRKDEALLYVHGLLAGSRGQADSSGGRRVVEALGFDVEGRHPLAVPGSGPREPPRRSEIATPMSFKHARRKAKPNFHINGAMAEHSGIPALALAARLASPLTIRAFAIALQGLQHLGGELFWFPLAYFSGFEYLSRHTTSRIISGGPPRALQA
jgi:hypothetical protein